MFDAYLQYVLGVFSRNAYVTMSVGPVFLCSIYTGKIWDAPINFSRACLGMQLPEIAGRPTILTFFPRNWGRWALSAQKTTPGERQILYQDRDTFQGVRRL
jgi:hypothetical protein